MPRRLDGERRNSLPTHLSESERERAVGMWMEGGTHEKGLGRRESESVHESKGKHSRLLPSNKSFIII